MTDSARTTIILEFEEVDADSETGNDVDDSENDDLESDDSVLEDGRFLTRSGTQRHA